MKFEICHKTLKMAEKCEMRKIQEKNESFFFNANLKVSDSNHYGGCCMAALKSP